MKNYVVVDSSVLIATLNSKDSFHTEAAFIFNETIKSPNVYIIIPPIIIYEVITTLIRVGLTYTKVQNSIMKLVRMDKVIILSIAETAAFKHAKQILKPASQMKGLRTADFLITSIAIDFNALILSFDSKAIPKIKPVYPKIYYCSSGGRLIDDTSDFLKEIGSIK